MNIANKNPAELIDTEIARLRKEVSVEMENREGALCERIDERCAQLKTAIEAVPEINRILEHADYLVIKDASITGDPRTDGPYIRLDPYGDSIQLSDFDNSAHRGNGKRRRWRFVVAAMLLPDEGEGK